MIVLAALIIAAAIVFLGLCILSAGESSSRAATAFDDLFMPNRKRKAKAEPHEPTIGL